jgi:cytochrome c
MKGKPGNWTYDELFKFVKAPGVDIPGTKMSFAGLRSEKDRINLIAYLRTLSDSPLAIPAPAPAKPAEAAPAAGGAAAPAGGAAPAAAPTKPTPPK